MADPFDTPGYRFALNRFPGDGVTTQWDLSFAGVSPGYISQDHVRAVLVNDTTGVETPVLLGPGNFILPTRLQITPAVPVGVTLEVRRNSPKDEPLLDYTDGALMIEKNLDTSNQQTVYAVAEMVDRFADALDDTAEFSQAVLDRLAEVENVADNADAKADTAISTANSAVITANNAVTLANQAIDTAEDAVEQGEAATAAAILATNAAGVATAAANNANAAATAATSTAAAAVNTAAQAVSTADSAVVIANAATATANGIDAKAQAALDASEVAVDTAEDAEATANGVDAKATQALADSATALSTANGFSGRITTLEGVVHSVALPTTAHDLNTYTARGVYAQNATSGAVAGSNYPGTTKVAGLLFVHAALPGVAAANLLWQEYVTYSVGAVAGSGRRYWRTAMNSSGSSWSPWREVPWDTEVMKHVYLTAATDCNTLIADNTFYTWRSGTVVTSGTNWPPTANISGGSVGVQWIASDLIIQTVTLTVNNARSRVFQRIYSGSAWQAWKIIAPVSTTGWLPTADAGDAYVDGIGWYRWNGTAYAAVVAPSPFPAGHVVWVPSRAALTNLYGTGWAPLDGQTVTRTDAPGLTAAVLANYVPVVTEANWSGNVANRGSYTVGNGSTTIRLPDLNGQSASNWGAVVGLRGDGTNSTGTAGQIQRDAVQNITGSVASVYRAGAGAASGALTMSSFGTTPATPGTAGGNPGDNAIINFDASTSARTATETRPVNVTGVWAVKL